MHMSSTAFFKEQILSPAVCFIVFALVCFASIYLRAKSRKNSDFNKKSDEQYLQALKKMDRLFDISCIVFLAALVLLPSDTTIWALIVFIIGTIIEGIVFYRKLKHS